MSSRAEHPPARATKGSILRGPYWPQPVRVLTTHVRDDRIEIDDLMHRTDLPSGRTNLRLRGPKDRARKEELGEPAGGVPAPLIDVLQQACVLWEREERVALSEFLIMR